MKCMNCGAELTESAYCPKCGCDVSVQKQAIVLSGLYYNQGLEKAEVRDLSGAIDQLKRSLKFNKLNVPARNLLGLVYFETGEVVSALSEWVISKNIQPEDNIAAEYIRSLQQDANRLDIINQTIKKYNIALSNCLQGNEDVALIQLKKILAQNPKLIKGYHLLALLYIHKEEYEKARRLLKKAIRIDKTNTTTLRFLREVDEQTGTATSLEPHFSIGGKRRLRDDEPDDYEEEEGGRTLIQPTVIKGGNASASLLNILIGVAIGAAAIWLLFVPAYTRNINRKANEKITKYSSDLAVYSAQIEMLQEEIRSTEDTVNSAQQQVNSANTTADSYDGLIKAVNATNNGQVDTAANELAAMDPATLTADGKAVFDKIAKEIPSALAAAYKQAGIAAFNSKDYPTAITKLEAAAATGVMDYDVLNYLAHAYSMSGDTANSDRVLNLIIAAWPDSQRAENAREYLSSPEAEITPTPSPEENYDDEEYDEDNDENYDEDYDENYDEDYDENYDEDYDENYDEDYDQYDDYDEDYDNYDYDEDYE